MFGDVACFLWFQEVHHSTVSAETTSGKGSTGFDVFTDVYTMDENDRERIGHHACINDREGIGYHACINDHQWIEHQVQTYDCEWIKFDKYWSSHRDDCSKYDTSGSYYDITC